MAAIRKRTASPAAAMNEMHAESGKPSYLGLLNAVSLAETAAGNYLTAWANATDDEELACTLRFVAARETSHGEVFCRRIAELGYELRQKHDPKAAETLVCLANPKVADCEKVMRQRGEVEGGDPFVGIKQDMANGVYDPLTQNLMTWYITEEKDSGQRLRKAYDAVLAKMNAANDAGMASARPTMASGAHTPSQDAECIMACMTEGFSRLERSIEKLVHAMR